ncbi:ankyrin repeat-containing domain protein [Obelidium mucronatum]|nr:ankyrin repeat-containing domain protein [Obelidium mucronatum]
MATFANIPAEILQDILFLVPFSGTNTLTTLALASQQFAQMIFGNASFAKSHLSLHYSEFRRCYFLEAEFEEEEEEYNLTMGHFLDRIGFNLDKVPQTYKSAAIQLVLENRAAERWYSIDWCVERGLHETLKVLLQDEAVIVPRRAIIRACVKSERIECLKLLLTDGRSDTFETLNIACTNGNLEAVELLLAQETVDPSVPLYGTPPIAAAAEGGNVEIINLLLQDKRVQPSVSRNVAIGKAAFYGHVDVVRLLLEQDCVDPSDNSNEAIRCACREGHTEVVKLLLTDPRVDPSANNNEAIRMASRNGRYETLQLLLSLDSSYNVDPGAENQECIRLVCEVGHDLKKGYDRNVVHLLLADERVDPTESASQALTYAAGRGDIELVKALLNDARVSFTNSAAAVFAACNGHVDVLKFLMTREQIRRDTDQSAGLLCHAATRGQIEVVGMLLDYPNQVKYASRALVECAEMGNRRMVAFLLDNSRLQDLEVTYSTLVKGVRSGNEELIRFLLGHPRLNVNSDMWVLSDAVLCEQYSVAKILLEDGRCNVTDDNVEAVRAAATNGSLDTLQALTDGLSWSDADAKQKVYEESLLIASEKGYFNISEYLVNQQAVSTTAWAKAAGIAYCNGHFEIVKFFDGLGYVPPAAYLEDNE